MRIGKNNENLSAAISAQGPAISAASYATDG